ncbi:response regulator transcription factor [Puteibacter caeruleilacunae]|nr:response regulator transcription factor [Puteibacter caeruleilacunae]
MSRKQREIEIQIVTYNLITNKMNLDLTTLIIDDEPLNVQLLEALLKPYPFLKVKATYTDPEEGLNAILQDQIDVVFMDIRMPGQTGIDLLKQINSFKPNTLVIFVTAYIGYTIEAIRNRAFDYLTKPVDRKELRTVIQRVTDYYKSQTSPNNQITQPVINATPNTDPHIPIITHHDTPKFLIKSVRGTHYLHYDEIVYLEADGTYTKIRTIDEEILTSHNLGKCLQTINAPCFVRISRKHAINTSYLSFINNRDKTCSMKLGDKNIILEYSIKLSELKATLQECPNARN